MTVTELKGMICSCIRGGSVGVRKRLFTERVVRLWNRIPRYMIPAPSLMEFKKCLDNTLRNTV